MPAQRQRSAHRRKKAARKFDVRRATQHTYSNRIFYVGVRFVLTAFAGLCIYASYEPNGLWFAAPVGIALVIVALQPWGSRSSAPGPWLGAFIAFTQALVTYLFYLPWVGEYVGSVPWIALSIVEALYSLLFGAGAVFLLCAARTGGRKNSRLTAYELLFSVIGVPLWYLAIEYARSHWPFGGFAWTRLAWGQVSGPLLSFARFGGPALVTVATVVMGIGFSLLVRRLWVPGLAIILVIPGIAGAAWTQIHAGPQPSAERIDSFAAPTMSRRSGKAMTQSSETEVTVAVIQGNVPRLGLTFNEQQRAVLANHRDATLALARRIGDHVSPKPDFVVWPENSSDVDPFIDSLAEDEIQKAAQAVGAPIILGTLTYPHGQQRNTVVVWDPDTGPGERHDKVYLQPFGEYMPWRSFFRHFSAYVDMVGDFTPGDDNGVVHVRSGTTNSLVSVGVETCYEVAFDEAFQHAIKGGAQIFSVPTNNATFGFTDMSYQQLAMSRLRSVEYDRATVVAATSGISAIIRPNGQVSERTQMFTEGILHAQLPLRATRTVASYSAPVVEWTMCGLGVGLLLGASVSLRLAKRVKSK
ncbi:apolipoprotein N-acyltransferase [Corynebacterium kroppenstedtii]|uniref:apolipoprotein N-acyltransferase n=1 Tax=Corynebacterium sp. PCR 32 TaxID=3351342 RepID=UPI003096B9E4